MLFRSALVQALEQALLLRGHRDFVEQAAYAAFVDGVVDEMNEDKDAKLHVELDAMTPVTAAWAPTFKRVDVRVGSQSTLRVDQNTYSVPSRLIGEQVEVRVHGAGRALEGWKVGDDLRTAVRRLRSLVDRAGAIQWHECPHCGRRYEALDQHERRCPLRPTPEGGR